MAVCRAGKETRETTPVRPTFILSLIGHVDQRDERTNQLALSGGYDLWDLGSTTFSITYSARPLLAFHLVLTVFIVGSGARNSTDEYYGGVVLLLLPYA